MSLNVYLCCLQSQYNWAVKAYKFWRENFKPALEEIGCNVIEPEGLDFIEPLIRRHDKKWLKKDKLVFGEKLFDQVKEAHKIYGLDLFFSYFYAIHIDSEVLQSIQDLGIPVVNFYCDNLRDFNAVKPIVRSVTFNWVPEIDALKLYKEIEAPAIYYPMAIHPKHYNLQNYIEIKQVSFIGSCDHLRMQLLLPLLDKPINLKIYGIGWSDNDINVNNTNLRIPKGINWWGKRLLSFKQHYQRIREYGLEGEYNYFIARNIRKKLSNKFRNVSSSFLNHQDFINILGNSTVSIGINRCSHYGYSNLSPLIYSRLRDIEVPGLGACYLTEDCNDIQNIFEVGKEVLTYKNSDELIDKINLLYKDSDLRAKLKLNGKSAVMERHTLKIRFKEIFKELGIKTT